MSDFTDKARIVFMGTPEFAVPSLAGLLEADERNNWKVVAVYTQPDRRSGRGKKVVASPVKQLAEAHEILVVQPERLRSNAEGIAQLKALAPDLIVVAAYGMILPIEVLDVPTFGAINLHASLLPAYRGASPITGAILDGLSETGNSIMLMEEGLDTGPVLAQEEEPIYPTDTTATLTERLSIQGAALLVETLPQWLDGELWPTAQDELAGEPSICRIIKKRAGEIDWQRSAAYIERMTRAYAPWPSAYTEWRDQPFKIISASVLDQACLRDLSLPNEYSDESIPPGFVVATSHGPAVGTGEALLLLHTVQPAGKRPMEIQAFLNGFPDFIHCQLPHSQS
ncbi:MAG: methionyl-tRNA formyltransferase [Chloroflexota bacterium]